MSGRWFGYSEEELAWIKARRRMTRRALHAAFRKRFRRRVKLDDIKALCTRRGWLTGRTGGFPKGHVPANKGKRCPPGKGGRHPNARRTQFRKGHRPHTWRGPGHESICAKDGYVILVVAEKNPWSGAATRPVLKHRWLWEKKHGPIPKGMCLKCLDGDKTNTDPSNWELISRGTLAVLNRRHNGLNYETAPNDVKPTILAIARLKQASAKKVPAPRRRVLLKEAA